MTLASSAPVTTAITPGAFFAAAASIALDPRVRVRRAHERDMRHARQRHVADVLRAALRQPRQVRPRHRAADVGVRPVERGEGGRDCRRRFSLLAPARCLRHRLDRIDDRVVAGAAAVVAGNVLADFLAARHAAVRAAVPARSAACRACRSRIAARCAVSNAACRSAISPESDTPSMVSTLAPSHCTASIRQPRTISPSTRTVQAPQTPCSQPTWLPVSARSSRRKSTSVLRASTRLVTVSPLTVSVMSQRCALMAAPP